MEFEEEIERFIKKWDYTPAEFGKLSCGNPNFVRFIRSGKRSPSLRLVRKIQAWMKLGPEVHAVAQREKAKRARGIRPRGRASAWTEKMDANLYRALRTLVRQSGRPQWIEVGRAVGVPPLVARRRAVRLKFWPIKGGTESEAA